MVIHFNKLKKLKLPQNTHQENTNNENLFK